MSEGRRIAPAYVSTHGQPGPSLPYAYEKSMMDQRASQSQRAQHALSSPAASVEHTDVLNLHQFVASRSSGDTSAVLNIGSRMARGEPLKSAVKSTAELEQSARAEALAIRGYLNR